MGRTLIRKRRKKKNDSLRTSTFDRNKMTQILSSAKKYFEVPKEQTHAKSQRQLNEDVRRKCAVNTIQNSSHVVETMRPTFSPYILNEFRKCLLHHDWPGAKKLLLLFLNALNSGTNQRCAWATCLTTLLHFPGAESVLNEFINMNIGSFDTDDFMRGLLTLNGLEAFRRKKIRETYESTTDEEDEDDSDNSVVLSDEDDDDDDDDDD